MHNRGTDTGTNTPERFPAQDRFFRRRRPVRRGRPHAGHLGPAPRGRRPATGARVLPYDLAGPDDVDAAVAAAREAFPAWAGATPGERSDALHRLAAVLAAGAEDFARAESLQCGQPLKLTREFDVPGTVDNTAFFAGAARHLQGRSAGECSGDHTSYVRREPLGVVGSVAPWNYPLLMARLPDPHPRLEDDPGGRRPGRRRPELPARAGRHQPARRHRRGPGTGHPAGGRVRSDVRLPAVHCGPWTGWGWASTAEPRRCGPGHPRKVRGPARCSGETPSSP
ncbi:hypothetical protein GCM10020295_22320 [Streptomyces cinereospinus]